MPTRLRWALFAFASLALHGQQIPYPSSINPLFLFVGSGATTLQVGNQNYTSGLTAFWNGAARTTVFNAPLSYTISLTAADLATPQLAVLTMVNTQTGAL